MGDGFAKLRAIVEAMRSTEPDFDADPVDDWIEVAPELLAVVEAAVPYEDTGGDHTDALCRICECYAITRAELKHEEGCPMPALFTKLEELS